VTAALTADGYGEHDRPQLVARAITGLLGSMPAPDGPDGQDLDDASRAGWFTRKADLLDAIASAAADPSLAVEAQTLAREARAAALACPRTARHLTSAATTNGSLR